MDDDKYRLKSKTAFHPAPLRSPMFAIPVTEGLDTFPKGPPHLPKHELTGPDEGWPPYPQGWTDVVALQAREISGGLTDEIVQKLRMAALAHGDVLKMLGEHYAYIYTSPVRMEKHSAPDCTMPIGARIVFYSYTHYAALEVLMTGTNVQSVHVLKDYQPPEGNDEIVEAICLARADKRLGDKVALLAASAILLPGSPTEELGYGNRILWVTFTEQDVPEQENRALFTAAVDLTERIVLMARAEPSTNILPGDNDA